jgi:hypothetical protein
LRGAKRAGNLKHIGLIGNQEAGVPIGEESEFPVLGDLSGDFLEISKA